MAAKDTKESWALYMREYRKKRPEVFRNIVLKKTYGITLDEYNQMLLDQNSVCAICGQSETKLDWQTKKQLPLCVDHCHTTGEIRGLLCADCNRALGMFKDNVKVLEAAIKYIKKRGA